jgi:signal transduction histidine kinase
MGIAEKDKAKIFDIFHRVHPRSEFPGEGIGLAACKKIVEAHGGKIWVTSELGRGSAFHFTLTNLNPLPAESPY